MILYSKSCLPLLFQSSEYTYIFPEIIEINEEYGPFSPNLSLFQTQLSFLSCQTCGNYAKD